MIEIEKADLLKTTCDRCGTELSQETNEDIRELAIYFAIGRNFPEGGYKSGWKIEDLCNSCVEWLKNWLIEGGVKLTEFDRDW